MFKRVFLNESLLSKLAIVILKASQKLSTLTTCSKKQIKATVELSFQFPEKEMRALG